MRICQREGTVQEMVGRTLRIFAIGGVVRPGRGRGGGGGWGGRGEGGAKGGGKGSFVINRNKNQ